MLRKMMIALVAIGTVAFAGFLTTASAYWLGGWHGAWRGPPWGYYGAPTSTDLARTMLAAIGIRASGHPTGGAWRRVWVCG